MISKQFKIHNIRNMEGRGSLKSDEAYKALEAYFTSNGENINIAELFAKDPDRFGKFR